MADAKFKESKLHDIAHFGIRATIGTIFIVHGFGKFDLDHGNREQDNAEDHAHGAGVSKTRGSG